MWRSTPLELSMSFTCALAVSKIVASVYAISFALLCCSLDFSASVILWP